MTSDNQLNPSSHKTETSPADFTADNAVSHGGRFGTDDTAPERSEGLPIGLQVQKENKQPPE